MATAIFFNGRRINIPQAVSRIDASALAAVAPAAVGIVALVGTAEGGAPLTVQEDLVDATTPNKVQERYRSGDLRTAGIFCFEPSQDDAVPGGAQKEILVKVNPATQSTITLGDDDGDDALVATSKDWGEFTGQVSIEVSAGTLDGKKYVVVFETNTETFDNVGGEAIFDVVYDPSTQGYDAMTGAVSATHFRAEAERSDTGLAAQRTNDIPAPGVLSVVSGNAGDTTQTITVYGLSGATVVSEVFTLNGTTPVVGAQSFSKVIAVRKSAATAGTVTVSDSPVVTTLFTLTAGVLTRGILDVTNCPVASNVLTVSIDVNAARDVVVLGLSPTGVVVSERFDMTAGATPVVGVAVFGRITSLLLGDIVAGRTITTEARAAETSHSQFSTVARVVDRLNTVLGFTANAIAPDYTTFRMVDADYHKSPARPAPSILTTAADFYADLYAATSLLTAQSQYVNAERATGGSLPPADTGAPVYLVGGGEGTTTITQWQEAFRLLEKRRYNLLVPLSRDPAVHSLALTHLIAKAGRLHSEAAGVVGIGTTGGAGETRTNIQAQIQSLNSRHIVAISQEINRFDPLTGEKTWYPPYILAAIEAGMKAGSAIAEPMTRKLILANDIRNDSSWSTEEDASDLIDRGLMMAEKVDGVGIRWIRSITTHLADDNLAFVEQSSNESLITFVYEFRTRLDKKVGQRGLGNQVGAITALARSEAKEMVDEEKIVGFRALKVEQVGDVFPVSIEVALVNPINFIPITVHLTPTVQLAA